MNDGPTAGRPDGQTVDLLAIAAHRDDVELTCGGTLAKAVKAGHRVGILDLTQGEMGTRGDAATRAAEAERAAKTLGVAVRLNAGMRDAHLTNDETSRKQIVELIRRTKPKVVILPFPIGRHPDHRISSELARDACYLAGLAKYEPGKGGEAYRPFKVLYALAYREDPVKPTFVVDISELFETKMEAIRCYASQFTGAKAAGEIHPTGQDLYELIRVQAAHYGSLIRRRYGEPFYTSETQEVDDVLQLGVQSM
ncbi:MAG: bacillithiol biosynthesis deacetylase BshB1 [Gemmatimonadetes bacterium]|nr:MAG: bacillithiol biosynthesis deacetylase BshB1 [Gemmatimonadota bacterium]